VGCVGDGVSFTGVEKEEEDASQGEESQTHLCNSLDEAGGPDVVGVDGKCDARSKLLHSDLGTSFRLVRLVLGMEDGSNCDGTKHQGEGVRHDPGRVQGDESAVKKWIHIKTTIQLVYHTQSLIHHFKSPKVPQLSPSFTFLRPPIFGLHITSKSLLPNL